MNIERDGVRGNGLACPSRSNRGGEVSKARAARLAVSTVLDGEWRTTLQLAALIGMPHRPTSNDLRPLREALYSLEVEGRAERRARQNGHLWRATQAGQKEAGES